VTSYIFSFKYKVLLRRLIIFAVVYCIALTVSGVFPLMKDGKTIYMSLHKINTKPGTDESYSLLKFREIDEFHNLDILFLGSSHMYQNVDNTIFEEYGYRTLNLGTSGQTPLNSYYLLREHLHKLKPKLIVYEVFPNLLASDGYSAYANLAVNKKISLELIQMGVQTKNLQFINILGISLIQNIHRDLKDVVQSAKYSGHKTKYFPGGFSAILDEGYDNSDETDAIDVKVNNGQLYYLEKTLALIREKNIDCVVITVPFVNSDTSVFSNYNDVTSQYKALIDRQGFRLIDYNQKVSYEKDIYNDWGHFNYVGARRFTEFLRQDLEQEMNLSKFKNP